MDIFTKEDLIKKLTDIKNMGWIENRRHGNVGGIGNTLEDLLDIQENNLPIPNANEWELKAQRLKTSSLITLFHCEPSPRAFNFVPNILLQNFGWKHQSAGLKYDSNEKSFRQTINYLTYTDRGFKIDIDSVNNRIFVSFNSSKVDSRHSIWLNNIPETYKINGLNPQPYWGFNDLSHKAGSKLLNCFYVQADVKRADHKEYYYYQNVFMLEKFSFKGFLKCIQNGDLLIDFDARTGHNHGTKFRLRQNSIIHLYEKVNKIL